MGKPLLKEDEVPSGGIADFIMSSDEIKQIEALEAREQFGGSGIANFEEVASRMASYGRFGDDTVAHLQKGEVIVPRALIEQNPKLKESIFNHLKELGIEDPERYVVGSSANSINPDTGMPEFFLGKIIKGVKNIFKSVGKVLKKAAPIVLPILGTLAFGPIYGAALGSGIGTLVQGGSVKDALKSALFAGATGAIGAGVGSAVRGGGFFEGIRQGFNPDLLRNPLEKIMSVPSKIMTPLKTVGETFPKVGEGGDYLQKGKELFFPETKTATDFIKEAELAGKPISVEVAKQYAKDAAPSFLRQYGPLALAGTGVMAATGMFDAPKDEEIQYETGKQLLEKDPEKYTPDASAYALNYLDPSLFGIPNQYYSANLQMQNPLVQSVKEGGEIFPRRTGGIAPDEGVAGKDSVRAMLMPGEFVMTTKAVKGMGNGNLDKGIDKMYDMMRNLEGRERMMA